MHRFVVLFATALLGSVPLSSHAARPVAIDWPRPEAAEALGRALQVTVDDARSPTQWRTVGAGVDPGFDPSDAPYLMPPRESWYLEHEGRFHRGLRRSVAAQLRHRGVFADPGRGAETASELVVQLVRFHCRDPETINQRCVGIARLRFDGALLPDVAVVVEADVGHPWTQLAAVLTAQVAERVAELDPAVFREFEFPADAQYRGADAFDRALRIEEEPEEFVGIGEFFNTDADLTYSPSYGSQTLARGVADLRVEVRYTSGRSYLRVLVAVDPGNGMNAQLHYNPPGAGWLRTPFEEISDSIYEARVTVPARGAVYIYVAGDAGRGHRRLAFHDPRKIELDRDEALNSPD